MKKHDSISSLLGVTQLEMSMLLHLMRGRWSMFESGKRDLPVPANLLMVEMLSYVRSREKSDADISVPTAEQVQKHRSETERRLEDNRFRLLKLEKQIALAQRKQLAQRRKSYLVEFLKKWMAEDEKRQSSMRGGFVRCAYAILEIDHHSVLANLEIKKKVLQYEQKLLAEAIA